MYLVSLHVSSIVTELDAVEYLRFSERLDVQKLLSIWISENNMYPQIIMLNW